MAMKRFEFVSDRLVEQIFEGRNTASVVHLDEVDVDEDLVETLDEKIYLAKILVDEENDTSLKENNPPDPNTDVDTNTTPLKSRYEVEGKHKFCIYNLILCFSVIVLLSISGYVLLKRRPSNK